MEFLEIDWTIHIHLISAIAWIGGAIFMFVLGISLRKKEHQDAVYPLVGPIYGYFEAISLVVLITSGVIMIVDNGLIDLLFSNATSKAVEALRAKLLVVTVIVVMTIIHMWISMKTLNRNKSKMQRFFSKASSMGIFILNLIVLHYAIILRNIL